MAELRTLLRDLPSLIRSIGDAGSAQAQGLAVSKFCRMMLIVDALPSEQRKDWKGAGPPADRPLVQTLTARACSQRTSCCRSRRARWRARCR
jgi:hypothetical protein